jgi:hypothetical protein
MRPGSNRIARVIENRRLGATVPGRRNHTGDGLASRYGQGITPIAF